MTAVPSAAASAPETLHEALGRIDQVSAELDEARDTLRAIGAGEVDAFVVDDGVGGHAVFSLSNADRPYRMFVERMREGAATISAAGLILYANDRLGDLLSCPKTSIVGRDLSELLVEEPGGASILVGHLHETGGTVELELLDAYGEHVPVVVGTSPLEIDGEILTCVTFTDLTAQKVEASERVAANEEIRFQALLLDTAGQAIVAVDGRGIVLFWNKHAEHMYGWSAQEAVGRSIGELILPDQTLAEAQEMISGMTQGKTWNSDHRVRHRDGTEFPIFATSTPIIDEDGNLTAMITVARDITEQIELERLAEESREHLLAAQHAAEIEAMASEEANRANRAKSEFLSRMSHELRTPLNAVLGFGQILLMDDLTTDQRENVDFICSAGGHLLDLINDVLDISRIEAGALKLSLEPVDLAEVLAHALSLLRPQAVKTNVSLPVEIDASDVFVLADRQRLLQVTLNLLSNAVKYNRPDGRIEVTCESSGGTVLIAVTDTGLGISTVDIGKLFTPFERLGAEGSDIEGTGVGLALARALSQQMGGSLTVSSTVGVGSTFTLELPGCDPVTTMEVDELVVQSTATRQSARPVTVLAIEDNVANVHLMERAMERCGDVTLLTAIQGRLGLEIAAQHHPDLILLDLHLPDLPGETVLSLLRADPETASIPVVICSADASPSQRDQCLARGATAYLTKPLRLTDLFELIEQARPAEETSSHGAVVEAVT
jgi:PAS domain S-box-containing protein